MSIWIWVGRILNIGSKIGAYYKIKIKVVISKMKVRPNIFLVISKKFGSFAGVDRLSRCRFSGFKMAFPANFPGQKHMEDHQKCRENLCYICGSAAEVKWQLASVKMSPCFLEIVRMVLILKNSILQGKITQTQLTRIRTYVPGAENYSLTDVGLPEGNQVILRQS